MTLAFNAEFRCRGKKIKIMKDYEANSVFQGYNYGLLGCLGFLFCYYPTLHFIFLPTHGGILLDFLQEFLEGRKNHQAQKTLLTSALSLS